MQIRAYIAYFITISVILIMAACSVVSHSAQDRQDIIPAPNQPEQQNDSLLPRFAHSPKTLPDTLKIPRQTTHPQNTSMRQQQYDTITKMPERQNQPIQQDSTINPIPADTTGTQLPANEQDTLQPKPLFNDVVNCKADDSIKFSIPRKEM